MAMIGSGFGAVASDALSEFVWISLSRSLARIVAPGDFGGRILAAAWLRRRVRWRRHPAPEV
jgi:hypothetical protein